MISMRLEGWNHIPTGYGASFDLSTAPFWLRLLVHVPLLDRVGFPIAVHRGFGSLTRHPDWPDEACEKVTSRWRVT